MMAETVEDPELKYKIALASFRMKKLRKYLKFVFPADIDSEQCPICANRHVGKEEKGNGLHDDGVQMGRVAHHQRHGRVELGRHYHLT